MIEVDHMLHFNKNSRLDDHYPKEATIRVVLNNHPAHFPKETTSYLANRSGRFAYVHTPKHGSCLNLIECAFSKMSRTVLVTSA
jgi:transposase